MQKDAAKLKALRKTIKHYYFQYVFTRVFILNVCCALRKNPSVVRPAISTIASYHASLGMSSTPWENLDLGLPCTRCCRLCYFVLFYTYIYLSFYYSSWLLSSTGSSNICLRNSVLTLIVEPQGSSQSYQLLPVNHFFL